jgi:integrase
MSYVQFLKYLGNENQTINKRVSVVRILMNWLYTNGFISAYELVFPKLESKLKPITTINDKQLILLIEYAKTHLDYKQLLIILLLISTGIRRNELVNIKISNIEFEEKRIYLDYTKSKQPRYIFINEEIILLIKKVYQNNTQHVYLFENRKGDVLNPSYVTGLLFELKKKLNFQVLSPHKLRHTYATFLLKNGANQEEVRRLLGHTDFKMTKRYIDYIDKDLQTANDKYNPLNLLRM